jgi:hypothetical protein
MCATGGGHTVQYTQVITLCVLHRRSRSAVTWRSHCAVRIPSRPWGVCNGRNGALERFLEFTILGSKSQNRYQQESVRVYLNLYLIRQPACIDRSLSQRYSSLIKGSEIGRYKIPANGNDTATSQIAPRPLSTDPRSTPSLPISPDSMRIQEMRSGGWISGLAPLRMIDAPS